MEYKCHECDKTFSSEEALKMHNNSKHYVAPKKTVNTKKIRNRAILIVVLALVIWGGYSLFQGVEQCETAPAETINIGGHSNLALHIHSILRISVDGNSEIIPGNVGVSSSYMRPVHTHDSSGELHIEGPCQRNFVLSDFFKIWGQDFYRDGYNVELYVDGVQNNNLENYILKDGEVLELRYTSI